MFLNYIGIQIKMVHSLKSWNGGVLVMVSGFVHIKDSSEESSSKRIMVSSDDGLARGRTMERHGRAEQSIGHSQSRGRSQSRGYVKKFYYCDKEGHVLKFCPKLKEDKEKAKFSDSTAVVDSIQNEDELYAPVFFRFRMVLRDAYPAFVCFKIVKNRVEVKAFNTGCDCWLIATACRFYNMSGNGESKQGKCAKISP